MKFTPETLQELRNKISLLEDQRTAAKYDIDRYTSLVARYQASYDEANAAIEDYTALLEYAEVTNGFGELTVRDVATDKAMAVGDALGSVWADPAVRRAVSETIAEQAARNAESEGDDDTPFASLNAEQANGNTCRVCAGEFKPGEAAEPSGYIIGGGQLFAHTACLDESGS